MDKEQIILALVMIGIVTLAIAVAPHVGNVSVDTNGVAVARLLMPGKLP